MAAVNYLSRLKERVKYLEDKTGADATLAFIAAKKDAVEIQREKATLLIHSALARMCEGLAINAGKANALSPLSILSRGYSIVEGESGVVKTTSDAAVGDELTLILADGKITAEVTEVIKEKESK